jgi:single-strand DNA-binding protein
MAGVNKVIIIGNLGNDPEVATTSGGKSIANFSIATSEKWKGKDGQPVEKTEWHRCVAFDKLADICSQYLKKGSKVFVDGKLQTDKYQKDGVDMYSTKIIVGSMQMLDSRDGEAKPAKAQKAVDDDFTNDEIPF